MSLIDHRALLRAVAAGFAGLAACLVMSAAHGQDLLVGQVASQSNIVTGSYAKGMYQGMKVYFDYVNAQGGIGGHQIRIVPKDDTLNPAKMIELTREFAADKDVLVLTGYMNTGGLTELAKQDLLAKLGIGLVSPLSGDRNVVGAANFFPFRSGYPNEVIALVKEAVNTGKKKVVVVYWNVTYGPPMVKVLEEQAKKDNLNVVSYIKVDATTPDKLDAIIKDAVAATVKEAPDAVIMLISSRYGAEYTKAIKNSPAATAQLYAMSVLPPADMVKAAGPEKTRGIIIAQSVPFPFSATLPLVFEYQKIMKQYAPGTELSFATLEGFAGAKITTEAIRRASPNPTREKVLKALSNMGEFNLGGVYVNYSGQERRGWGSVDLTIIGAEGKLLR